MAKRGRVLFVCAVLVVLPILAGLFTTRKLLIRRQGEQALQRTAEISQLAAILVTENFSQPLRFLQSMAGRSSLIEQFKLGQMAPVTANLQEAHRLHPDFFFFTVYSLDGTVRAMFPLQPRLINQNFAFRDWYKGVIATKQPYVSEVYRTSAEPQVLVVACAVPIVDESGAVIGIMMGTYKLDVLVQRLNRVNSEGKTTFLVLDQNGMLAASPDVDMTKDPQDFSRMEPYRASLRATSGSGNYSDGGNPYAASFVRLPELRWTVIARQLDSERSAGLRSIDRSLWPLSIILVGFGLVGTVLLSTFYQRLDNSLGAVTREVEERKRAQQEVEAQSAQRAQAMLSLEDSEAKFRNMTMSASDGILLANSAGAIIYWNRSAEQIFGYSEAEIVGEPLSQLLPERYREEHLRETARYLATGEGTLIGKTVELRARRKSGLEFPMELSLASWKTGERVYFGGFLRDIGERKRAERHLAVQYAASRVLAESLTVGEAVARILQAISESINWKVAELWEVQPPTMALHCVNFWHSPELSSGQFEPITRPTSFEPGMGLPGHVWLSGEPTWIGDVQKEADFVCASFIDKSGLHSAFAVPIVTLSGTIGIMEFFSQESMERDDDLLQLVKGIGDQLGQFIERKKAEEALREQETRLRAITETASDAIISVNARGKIVYLNHAAERTFGYSAVEAIGLPLIVLMPEKYHYDYRHGLGASLLGKTSELSGKRKDGTEFPFELSLARWETVSETFYTGMLRDITERKWAEKSLLLSEERFRSLSESSPVGIFQTDKRGHYLYTNLRWQEMSGLMLLGSLGDGWVKAIHPEDRSSVHAEWEECVRLGTEFAREFRFIMARGEIRWVRTQTSALRTESGEITGYVGTTEDMTQRKLSEEALEQSRQEQMRLKDEFLSHVSHELRSPLAAIYQFITIISDGLAGEVNPEQREYLQIAVRNIRQLQAMIEDLLDVTRAQTGKLSLSLEGIYVSEIVSDTIDTLQSAAAAKGVTLSADIPAGIPPAYGDPARIRQILINLGGNAIKFTPKDGTIKVRARIFEKDPKFLVIDISDTGAGISPELTERIFERLYQVSEDSQAARKGLGLGLFICKELVQLQGGKIWVTSEVQKGSTFSFTVPIVSLAQHFAGSTREKVKV